jgi:DNA-binding NtrC family response regulator
VARRGVAMSSSKPIVLVIDDDDQVRKLLVQQLKLAEFAVLSARDGDQGIEMLSRNKVDLILVDIVMPGKDGVQTITNVRITHPDLRIIAMSGDIDSALYLKAAERLGVRVRLQKPFTMDQMLKAIDAAMK